MIATMRKICAALVSAFAVSACLSSANLSGGGGDVNPDGTPLGSLPEGGTCAADLKIDVGNCGACGKVCANQANAYGLCKEGACAIGCNTGFGDCDSKPETGCESTLATDSNHCGTCGKSCGGARCVAGQCQPLAIAEIPGYVSAVAQDATDLYYGFSAGGNYAIGRLAKDASKGHTEVVAGILKSIPSLAVTTTDVYWTRANEAAVAAPADGAIHRAAKTMASAAGTPWIGALRISYGDSSVVADGSAFYATTDTATPPLSTLSRAAVTGTTSTATAQGIKGTVQSVAVDGAIAYYFASGDNTTGVGRGLYSCPTSGCGMSSTLVPGPPANTYLYDIAVNGPHLYFSTGRAVARMKKDGTEYAVLGTSDSSYPYVISYATDGTRIYWIERVYSGGGPGGDEYFTWTCPIANCKDGRQPVVVPGEPLWVLGDDKAFYILARTNSGAGNTTTVLKVLK